MQGLRAAIAMISSLIIANLVLWLVAINNQEAGIYPPESDSISIPLLGCASTSLVILISMGIAVSLPKQNRFWQIARSIPALFALLLSLLMALSWLEPNHYLIAAAFLLVAIACAWSWWQDRLIQKTHVMPRFLNTKR